MIHTGKCLSCDFKVTLNGRDNVEKTLLSHIQEKHCKKHDKLRELHKTTSKACDKEYKYGYSLYQIGD